MQLACLPALPRDRTSKHLQASCRPTEPHRASGGVCKGGGCSRGPRHGFQASRHGSRRDHQPQGSRSPPLSPAPPACGPRLGFHSPLSSGLSEHRLQICACVRVLPPFILRPGGPDEEREGQLQSLPKPGLLEIHSVLLNPPVTKGRFVWFLKLQVPQ